LKAKLTDELITALLEVMNIPKSGYIEASLREKLAPLNPKHYTEVMMNLMDNQDRYAKPIEKVSLAIQKLLDKYNMPNDVSEVMGYLKRSYKGRVISDNLIGVFKEGVKIALSADGEHFVNLYNGQNLSDADSIEVIEWVKNNPEKIGIISGYEYDHTKSIPMLKDDELEIANVMNKNNLIANIAKDKVMR